MKENKSNDMVAQSASQNTFSSEMPIHLEMPCGYKMTEDGIFLNNEDTERAERICINPILITKISKRLSTIITMPKS